VPVLDIVMSPKLVQERYRQLREAGHREIMLTGGEPMCHPIFPVVVQLAWSVFRRVHLTTQDTGVLDGALPLSWRLLSSVVLSVHDQRALREVLDPSIVLPPYPVYVAVMADFFYRGLVPQLWQRGYAGLTINEDVRSTDRDLVPEVLQAWPCTELAAHDYDRFSIRINRRWECLDDTPILLPDLTLINSFRPYL
jgi:hypothetical protein